jgi:hypothetical protein
MTFPIIGIFSYIRKKYLAHQFQFIDNRTSPGPTIDLGPAKAFSILFKFQPAPACTPVPVPPKQTGGEESNVLADAKRQGLSGVIYWPL